MRALNSSFFGPMNLRKVKKLSTFMNLTAINVTKVWIRMNFNQVMRTENVMKITFVYVSKFMLCIASWKLER